MRALRRKLGDNVVRTVHGVGYALGEADGEDAEDADGSADDGAGAAEGADRAEGAEGELTEPA